MPKSRFQLFTKQGVFMTNFTIKSILATTTLAFMGMGAVNAQEITGAGASFPAPVYSKWAADYNKATGVKVNYQSVGSGAGIKQIDSKTVDFGAIRYAPDGRCAQERVSSSFPP
jgi:phosphate transport system substrate-binding protein